MAILSWIFPWYAQGKDITLYTSEPYNDITYVIQEFNKFHPEIRVKVYRSGTIEIQKKIMAEKLSGTVHADLIMISDHVVMEILKQKHMLLKISPADVPRLPMGTFDDDYFYFGTKIITIGFLTKGKNSPRIVNWRDLLSFNKIVIPNPEYSGVIKYVLSKLSADKSYGFDFIKELTNKSHMVTSNGQVIEMVFMLPKSVGIIVDFMALKKIKTGSKLTFHYPEDKVFYVTEPIAIFKNTENKEESLTFLNFVLSEQGQACFYKLGYTPIYAQKSE